MKTRQGYLICYDISDEKRLAKVAKYLEKVALRIQYSIYALFEPSQKELFEIEENIKKLIDTQADDVRIYTIKNSGYRLGIATNLDEPFIIV